MAGSGDMNQDISSGWEDEPWMTFLNSENSAVDDEDLSQMMNTATNSSNSPTPTEVAAAAEEPDVVVLTEPAAKAAAAAMPPPPAVGKRKRKNEKEKGNDQAAVAGGSGGNKGGGTDNETHIQTERERRKKMQSMFSELQELLPQLPQKVDKITVVDEAVSNIKTLEQKLQNLQKQKLDRLRGVTATTTYHQDPHGSVPTGASSSREAFLADHGGSSMNPEHEMGISTFGMAQCPTNFKTWASPNLVLSVCGDRAQINICCPRKLGVFSAICHFLEKYKIQVISANASSDQHRSMYMIQAQVSAGVDRFFMKALSCEDIFQLAIGDIMMHMSTL